MWENIIGHCKECKTAIYIDEGYHKIGEHIFEGILCEECSPKVTDWLDFIDEEVEKIPNEHIIDLYASEVIESYRDEQTSTREQELYNEILKRINKSRC